MQLDRPLCNQPAEQFSLSCRLPDLAAAFLSGSGQPRRLPITPTISGN
jgi:hypothetical protein